MTTQGKMTYDPLETYEQLEKYQNVLGFGSDNPTTFLRGAKNSALKKSKISEEFTFPPEIYIRYRFCRHISDNDD